MCKKIIFITEEKGNVLGQCSTTIKPVEVDNRNVIECPIDCDKKLVFMDLISVIINNR